MTQRTKAFLFVGVVALAAIAFTLLTSDLSEFKGRMGHHRVEQQRTTSPQAAITMREYSMVETGMSYDRVCLIMGTRGTETSNSGNMAMYSWANRDGSNMTALFRDGVLASKAQLGLK